VKRPANDEILQSSMNSNPFNFQKDMYESKPSNNEFSNHWHPEHYYAKGKYTEKKKSTILKKIPTVNSSD